MNPKSKILLFVIVSFLLGLAGGFFAGRRSVSTDRARNGRPSQSQILQEFKERLMLDEAQVTAVDSLLESQRRRFSEFRKQYWGSFRAQRDSLRGVIRSLLTEEQNVLYDRYLDEMDKREAKGRSRRE